MLPDASSRNRLQFSARRRSPRSQPQLAFLSADKITLRFSIPDARQTVGVLRGHCFAMPPAGIEPASQAPEACVLSVELWRPLNLCIGQRKLIGSQNTPRFMVTRRFLLKTRATPPRAAALRLAKASHALWSQVFACWQNPRPRLAPPRSSWQKRPTLLPPAGIEPASPVPKTGTLSVELQGQE